MKNTSYHFFTYQFIRRALVERCAASQISAEKETKTYLTDSWFPNILMDMRIDNSPAGCYSDHCSGKDPSHTRLYLTNKISIKKSFPFQYHALQKDRHACV